MRYAVSLHFFAENLRLGALQIVETKTLSDRWIEYLIGTVSMRSL